MRTPTRLAVSAIAIAAQLGCATQRSLATSDLVRVREADLRRAFPELKRENRLAEACLWEDSVPVRAVAVFTPTVVGDHRVETARIECTSDGGSAACDLHRAPAYFATDPDKCFDVGEGADLDEAITVARLFEEGAAPIQESAGDPREEVNYRVFEIRKMPETYLLRVWSSMYCGGCDGLLHVTPIFENGRMVGLQSNGYPAAGCVIPPPKWLEAHPE